MTHPEHPYQHHKHLRLGDIFTPLTWGIFAIEKFNLFEKWLKGATLFDPTMGEGNLLEALIEYGLYQGYTVEQLPTHLLFGNELNTQHYLAALHKFKDKYALDMTSNFSNTDILLLSPQPYHIVFGNPPWKTFADLPDTYKQFIKNYFHLYDLVHTPQSLLLGGSRIDIAALVIQIVIKNFLYPNGEAIFFTPLSLLLNDGAHESFRAYTVANIHYCLTTVYDFNDEDVFSNVSTRYGLIHLLRDKQCTFPILYYRIDKGNWELFHAQPHYATNNPLSVTPVSHTVRHQQDTLPKITLNKEYAPRQGINTCGANHVFFFDHLQTIDDDTVKVTNRHLLDGVVLPKIFLFPLLTAKNFQKKDCTTAFKWVLLPYTPQGKPLEWEQLLHYPLLVQYLLAHQTVLIQRKGVLLNSYLKRGYWWALLGVGAYNFFAFKLVWEAYGRNTFSPQLVEGHWQANQSLQAFIPVRTKTEAEALLVKLSDKRIEQYLLSLQMAGTMNWAQPGRIKKMLQLI